MDFERVQCHGHAVAAEIECQLAVDHFDAMRQARVLACERGTRPRDECPRSNTPSVRARPRHRRP